ncbi:very short patch repair endonuclease [Nesterenkonia jeotgali]|uniref:very short patch repair endonuclease n=1 Tax=Nesterenkonia jeotgali TaxID=317018 RepID=UPI0022B5F463|nr:very short patch repair endonuclease [Nesterenkonia jeotgali]
MDSHQADGTGASLTSRSWASSENARLTMRANKGRDTKPELLVRRALHARGWRFRVNYRPLAADRRRSVDIAFTRRRVVVLIDGCYWHGCPQHFIMPRKNQDYWSKKISGNRARDVKTSRLLADEGWTVLRYWEHESVEDVLLDIERALGRKETKNQPLK